jgi:hypothetical protein
MPFPDYLDRKPRIIFFTDFDCTVTAEDMTDWLAGVNPRALYIMALFVLTMLRRSQRKALAQRNCARPRKL